MKNLLKASLILMFPFVLSSCSKSDDEKPQNAKEAVIKVEVTNNQSSNFSEFLNIQVVSNNIGSTDVTGVTWDDKQSPSANTKWFVKQGDIKPTIVYQTTNKVTSLTYAVVITSKLATTTPLITTFKFYADDKLIKTETATTLDKATNVTIPIVVTDL
jgi:hypothetical protein